MCARYIVNGKVVKIRGFTLIHYELLKAGRRYKVKYSSLWRIDLKPMVDVARQVYEGTFSCYDPFLAHEKSYLPVQYIENFIGIFMRVHWRGQSLRDALVECADDTICFLSSC